MPEYLSPGVYIEETEIGGKPIEGVSTTTAGFLGQTERGPTRPRLVTCFEQYRRLYGGFISTSNLPYAVDGFFRNGGKRCFIGRILGKNSRKASLEMSSQNSSTPSPSTPAAPDNTEGDEPKNAQSPPSGGSKKSKSVKTESGGNPGKAFAIEAIGPGTWGNSIGVKIEAASLSKRNPNLFKLTVMYWKTDPPDLRAIPIDPQPEVYDNLSCEPSSSDFYEKRINNVSALIEISQKNGGISTLSDDCQYLTGGSDGDQIGLSDYQGQGDAHPGERTGLAAFTEVDEISMVCVPNESDCDGLTLKIVNHCEQMKDRFAILQASQSAEPISELEPPIDSKYAAFYYPWINVMDPLSGTKKLIPPGGHIAGIYARSDIERGVHKAPANEIVRGAVELQFPLTSGEQDILNPRGVNCLRKFRGRGIRVWGARTTSSDSLWKYVNVRRLFLYIEESIEEGTQWVVFEPNNEKLWARVRQSITAFLTTLWRAGWLMGTKAEEAFFVKCDRSTMTQDDIDNGRLICVIGIAPVKPAEFVIFRIAQWPGGSAVNE
jgi:phage tail sheath protein FI